MSAGQAILAVIIILVIISIWRGDSRFEHTRVEEIRDNVSDETLRFLRGSVESDRSNDDDMLDRIDSQQFTNVRNGRDTPYTYKYPVLKRSDYYTVADWPPDVREKAAADLTGCNASRVRTIRGRKYCVTVNTESRATQGGKTGVIHRYSVVGGLLRGTDLYVEVSTSIFLPACTGFAANLRGTCQNIQRRVNEETMIKAMVEILRTVRKSSTSSR